MPVSSILPGVIDTPIWETSAADTQARLDARTIPADKLALYAEQVGRVASLAQAGQARGIPPLKVAEAVQRALTATVPRARYYVGRDAHVLRLLVATLPPHWIDALFRRG